MEDMMWKHRIFARDWAALRSGLQCLTTIERGAQHETSFPPTVCQSAGGAEAVCLDMGCSKQQKRGQLEGGGQFRIVPGAVLFQQAETIPLKS